MGAWAFGPTLIAGICPPRGAPGKITTRGEIDLAPMSSDLPVVVLKVLHAMRRCACWMSYAFCVRSQSCSLFFCLCRAGRRWKPAVERRYRGDRRGFQEPTEVKAFGDMPFGPACGFASP